MGLSVVKPDQPPENWGGRSLKLPYVSRIVYERTLPPLILYLGPLGCSLIHWLFLKEDRGRGEGRPTVPSWIGSKGSPQVLDFQVEGER